MDLGFEDIRNRKYTNKRGINKTHIYIKKKPTKMAEK